MTQSPEGFLLLTIADCKLISSTGHPPDLTGTLALECVTLPISSTANNLPDRDVWLILRLGNFEMPISPNQTIVQSRAKRTFTFPKPESPNAEHIGQITIVLPSPQSAAVAEDHESLEVLLSQYAILQEIDPDPPGSDGDLKGRLVLVDQDDGEYVGMLGNNFHITEDPSVKRGGKEPVIIEIPEQGNQVHVHSVRPEEEDMLLRSAAFISRGIVSAANMLASGMTHASSHYIANTTPNPEPLVFSETTQGNVRRIHHISGQAVKVTSKTTGMIHQAVDMLTNRLAGRSPQSQTAKSGQMLGVPPPLPPRSGRSSPVNGASGSMTPTRKPRLLNRLLLSTDMLITALEHSATTLLTSGTQSLSTGVGHKYGKDAGEATRMFGETARNVSVVYIDARGVGRRALLKRVGKGVIKGRLGSRQVVLGEDVRQAPSGPPIGGENGKSGGYEAGPPPSYSMTPPPLPPRK